MKLKRMAVRALSSIIVAVALGQFAWAADCGDTAGPGGIDVPCSCGDTVVTNTTLISPNQDPVNGDPVVSTADADLCTGDGLLMAPPTLTRMTLNLGGNAIRGAGTAGSVGLRIVGAGVRVSIRNGTLRNFETGLSNVGSGTGDARVREISAVQNVNGIKFEGNSHELDSNQALDNTGIGIQVAGNSNAVIFNQASRNGGNGIEVIGDQNRLDTNRVNRNLGSGIVADGDRNIVSRSVADNSGLDGIQVVGNGDGDPTTLEVWKNKMTKNGRNGIAIDGNDLEISANQGTGNREDGLSIVGTGNHIDTNVMRENKGDGLIATGGGNFDDGGNVGKKNSGVQCQIDGAACRP